LPNESWRYYRDNRLGRIKKRTEKKRREYRRLESISSTKGKEFRKQTNLEIL